MANQTPKDELRHVMDAIEVRVTDAQKMISKIESAYGYGQWSISEDLVEVQRLRERAINIINHGL